MKIPTDGWDPLPSPTANSESQSGGMDSACHSFEPNDENMGDEETKGNKTKRITLQVSLWRGNAVRS